jgi:hypothetical protein
MGLRMLASPMDALINSPRRWGLLRDCCSNVGIQKYDWSRNKIIRMGVYRSNLRTVIECSEYTAAGEKAGWPMI